MRNSIALLFLLVLALLLFFSVECLTANQFFLVTPQARPTKIATGSARIHRQPFSKSKLPRHAVPGADIEQELPELDAVKSDPASFGSKAASFLARGKVNEIDFCIAPADISLSRAYKQISGDDFKSDCTGKNRRISENFESNDLNTKQQRNLSLTQYLNNASNRAVRRILLARCWPSPAALNLSLRIAAAAEKQAQEDQKQKFTSTGGMRIRCPVPRPILNVLMRRERERQMAGTGGAKPEQIRDRTDKEYVADQISSFRRVYGSIPGFQYAEAYLESVLSLATSGIESVRAREVIESGVYDTSYRRVVAVLKSVGAVFESTEVAGKSKIGMKLVDQDISLSMLDKINIKREKLASSSSSSSSQQMPFEKEAENGALSVSKSMQPIDNVTIFSEVVSIQRKANRTKDETPWFRFWKKRTGKVSDVTSVDPKETSEQNKDEAEEKTSNSKGLGQVILGANEPTMTRQLNVLSNIVQRVLLFGGDQMVLVLLETLETSKGPFIERWYPETAPAPATEGSEEESRPGVQYFNALLLLLQECYDNGIVMTLDPFVPLIPSYANAYERLMAMLVELGSGYIRPVVENVLSMPKPRTATEELGRFAVWEANFRAESGGSGTTYPDDLEGIWEVRDEVSGETIGISTVAFESQGDVVVDLPMQGLRWRLDPGPTHLDTCTFQVLGEDGTILQYRGFIDRGARLEARFSKRPIVIRGSVMFQMRDGDVAAAGSDYWNDMLPINYKTGTTKFVMTKKTV